MNKFLSSKGPIYIFYALITMLLIYAFIVFSQFNNTKKFIQNSSFNSNIKYIHSVATNIANKLKKKSTGTTLIDTLKQHSHLRKELESDLELFQTERYRYIYVVTKEKGRKKFKFLLDGAQENKSDFLDNFTPLKIDKWISVYKTKKACYFQNEGVENLWITYLYPIVINNQVEAILAIDFSLEEQKNTEYSLNILSKSSKVFIFLALFILVVALFLLIYEMKKAELIKTQSEEINKFNTTLKEKIKQEIEKNREKDKQLLQQSKLAQMGEMMSMIAHQWRQPLTAISAASGNLILKAKLDKLDNESVEKLGEKISGYAQHLSATIDDFRDFFKPKKEYTEATYKELLDSVLGIVEASLKNNNIELKEELHNEVILYTYENELKQVILNLIKNAEDILKEKEIENPTITIEIDGYILKVRDNAGGVPEDIIDKIFEPYFSTKSLNGTGLGLYMSKTIIEEHCGGKLSVYNDDEGAVFSIELPKNSNCNGEDKIDE